MKVELKISEDTKEPYVVIFTNSITEEIQKIIATFEMHEKVISANDNERIIVLRPEEIYMVRIEQKEVVIYCESKKYTINKRLYELEDQLGKDFMRISKSTIINLKKIDCVEPSFNGMMYLLMKNGCKDYISRNYLPQFKKYLGI